MTTKRVPRPLLWLAVLGLLLMASACGSDPNAEAIANDKATIAAMSTAIAAEQAEPAATDTSAPTATPLPTDTPVPTSTPTATETPPPTSTLAVKESAGDSLSLPSPTPEPIPEGIILFLSTRDHSPMREDTSATYMELYAMRPDGSQQTRLSDGTLSLYNYPPTYITPYYIEGQIVIGYQQVFDLQTRRVIEEVSPVQVVDGHPLKFASGYGMGESPLLGVDPVWSSTGEIVFSGSRLSDDPFSIFFLPSIHDPVQRFSFPPEDTWGDGFPAWSPDGNRIVFDRQWNDYSQDGLWIITKDGSQMRRLVEPLDLYNGTRQPAWSPDGQTIAYEGYKENNDNHYAFELWVADVSGQGTRQLTNLPETESAWAPVWSPNSQKIAFEISPNPNYMGSIGTNVYVVDVKGGSPQQLTFEGTVNLSPLWLPLDADEILAGGDTPMQEPPTPTPRPQAPAAQPAKATNCPSAGVEISSPAAGARFTQRNNFIVGTANIPNFHHWRIEYSTDPNGGWSYLLERDYPVDNDKLVMIDASTIPNGPYGLRLTVVDQTGNYPEPCEVWFTNGY